MQGQPQFRDMAKETDPLEPILEDLYEPDHDPPAAVSGYEYEPSEFAPEEMPAEVPGIVTVMMPGMREEREKELQGETEETVMPQQNFQCLLNILTDHLNHCIIHLLNYLLMHHQASVREQSLKQRLPVPEKTEGGELAVDDVRFVDM